MTKDILLNGRWGPEGSVEATHETHIRKVLGSHPETFLSSQWVAPVERPGVSTQACP